MKITRTNQHRRGAAPLWVLLVFLLVLLVIAVGVLGYIAYSSYSQTARIEKEKAALQLAAEEQKNKEHAADLERQKGEDAARQALAKNQQEAFALRARNLTNDLGTILTTIPALEAQLEALSTGDAGRKVAVFPDLVVAARSLFQTEVPQLPTRPDTIQRLESIRRLLQQLADHAGTAFEPTPDMTATLEDTRIWTDTARHRQDNAKAVATTLLSEAQVKLPPDNAPAQPPTLKDAIAALSTQEWDERQRITTQKTVEAQKVATATTADATTNAIINQAKIEADRRKAEEDQKRAAADIEIAQNQAQIEIDKLRAEARTAQVQQALTAFTTPGSWIVTPGMGPKFSTGTQRIPVSLSGLQSAGCLDKTTDGLIKLWHAASSKHDKLRPRWPAIGSRPKAALQDAEKYNRVTTAQDYLIRLGPYLVEQGSLSP